MQACFRHSMTVCMPLFMADCLFMSDTRYHVLLSTYRFACSICAHYERQGFVKFNHSCIVRRKASDAFNEHLHIMFVYNQGRFIHYIVALVLRLLCAKEDTQ